jgi:hypothetical protein
MFIVWCTLSVATSWAVKWISRFHTCISHMTAARSDDADPLLIWVLYGKPRNPTGHEQVASTVGGGGRAWKHAFITTIGSPCEQGGAQAISPRFMGGDYRSAIIWQRP